MTVTPRNSRRKIDKRAEFLKYYKKFPGRQYKIYAGTFGVSETQICRWLKEAARD